MFEIGSNLHALDFEEYLDNAESQDVIVCHEDIRNIYKFDKKPLGRGHFGSVRKAYLRADKTQTYAVKSISKKRNTEHFG